MSLRSTLTLVILALVVASPALRSQVSLTPIDFTNRPLGNLNDASAVGWNPSILGVHSSGWELVVGAPFDANIGFNKSPYGIFVKGGPVGAGIIAPLYDTLEPGMVPTPQQYYLGFGFPMSKNYFWFGVGTRWYDGEGFFKSAEVTASASIHPSPRIMAGVAVENVTGNNGTGTRFSLLGNYHLSSWLDLNAGARYNPADTLFDDSPLRLAIGAAASLFDNSVNLSAQYDITRQSYRIGLEVAFSSTNTDFGAGAYAESRSSSGLQGGMGLVRYSSQEDPLDAPPDDDIPPARRNPRGWAPERAYTPVGLVYKHRTTDATASPDALIRPCDGSGLEFDAPDRLMSVLPLAGKTYTGLTKKLKEMAPNPFDLYKVIRSEYYTTLVRSRELRNGDSLALLSRAGHSIGVQAIDQSKFPQVSLIMQVTDRSGRNVPGLGINDFTFRDTSLKIVSVRPVDSSFNVPVDIVMIVDCSGSMREEIQSVRANVQSFVNTMQTRGADYRIGGVLYGAMIYDTLHPTAELDRFKEFAANADAIGTDEITTLAIKTATEMNFRPASQRVFILITDDWAIQDNALLTEPDLVEMLWNTGARLYTIGSPCSNNGAAMTRLSLGREYNITSPFNSILDDIGADVTTFYELTYLSRMRAEEALPSTTILRGQLRDETGRPTSVPISFAGKDRNVVTVTPNPTTGEFEAELAEGISYKVTIAGRNYLPLSETVDMSATKRGDTVVRNFTLRLPPTALSGQVTDEKGAPVSADVRITDALTGERITSVRSGRDGRYTVALREGNAYRIEAMNPDYIPTEVELDTRGVERGSKLEQDLKVTSIEWAIANGSTFQVKNIFFDFAKWDLKPESFVELDRVVALLEEYPTINVEIGAHTDAVGSDQDNQVLSGNRARSVVDYLVSKGITARRLRSKGYGESVPIATNDTDEGRALNRRVEFKLVR